MPSGPVGIADQIKAIVAQLVSQASQALRATTVNLGNLPNGGIAGTSAATIDSNGCLIITQTTAGQTVLLPSPTNPTAGTHMTVLNNGTQNVTIQTQFGTGASFLLPAGTHKSFVWDGNTWRPSA